jgi:hypothetical protein
MSRAKYAPTQIHTHLDFASVVPVTPGEAAASSARWERRGLLGRLVRVN